MHPLDIPIAETGGPFRPLQATPVLLRRVLSELFFNHESRAEPVAIDQPLPLGKDCPSLAASK